GGSTSKAPKLSGSAATTSSTVTITLVCGSKACSGRVTLTSGKTIGSASYSIKAGRRAENKIKLTPAGRKLLQKKHGRLSVKLKLTPKSGASVTKTLTLKVKH